MIKINLQEIKNGKKNRNESKIEFMTIYAYTRVNIRPIDLQSGTDSTIELIGIEAFIRYAFKNAIHCDLQFKNIRKKRKFVEKSIHKKKLIRSNIRTR